MKNRLLLLCLLAATCTVIPTQARGDGYGFFSWGIGFPRTKIPGFLTDELSSVYDDVRVDLMYNHFTIGYLYDGAFPYHDLFGFRFTLGFDVATATLENLTGGEIITYGYDELAKSMYDATGLGLSSSLTMAFKILERKSLRFWVGPCVRFNADYLMQSSATVDEDDTVLQVDPWGISMSLGGGVETGVRYDFGTEVSLNASIGFLYNFFAIYQDARLTWDAVPVASDSFMIGQEPYGFVQIGIGFSNNPLFHMAPD